MPPVPEQPADQGVWHYHLGGYQVLKKWLPYRELTILDRSLRADEIQHFTDMARCICRILTGSRYPFRRELAKDFCNAWE